MQTSFPAGPWDGSSKSRPTGLLTDAAPDSTDWRRIAYELYQTQLYLLAKAERLAWVIEKLFTSPTQTLLLSQSVTVVHLRGMPTPVHRFVMTQSVKVVKITSQRVSQVFTIQQNAKVVKPLVQNVTQKLNLSQTTIKKGK